MAVKHNTTRSAAVLNVIPNTFDKCSRKLFVFLF